MKTILNVAGKPWVAEKIAKILAAESEHQTTRAIKENTFYDFKYEVDGKEANMVFTSVNGPLSQYSFDERNDNLNDDPKELFNVPVQPRLLPDDRTQKIVKNLKTESQWCTHLYLWFDNDAEGEYIASEVAQIFKNGEFREGKVYRKRFISFDPRRLQLEAATTGINRIDYKIADSVNFRKEIEFRSSAAFTRFQTKLLGRSFKLDTEVINYGMRQFSTLGIIVERFLWAKDFNTNLYYTITCEHKTYDGTTNFELWKAGKATGFDTQNEIIKKFNTNYATVQKVTTSKGLHNSPIPLNNLELMKLASRYLKMSSERTMEVAEELYALGLISYPYTISQSFEDMSPELLSDILNVHQRNRLWGAYCHTLKELSELEYFNFSKGLEEETPYDTHLPIHPTAQSCESHLNTDQKDLYELIVRHFLAAISTSAKRIKTKVVMQMGNTCFKATGIQYTGTFSDVYTNKYESNTQIKKLYESEEKFKVTSMTSTLKSTKAIHLNESELLDSMYKAKIGIDYTMHSHIESLIKSSLAIRVGCNIKPTTLGLALIEGYQASRVDIWKRDVCTELERDVDAISSGSEEKSDILNKWMRKLTRYLKRANNNKHLLKKAFENHNFAAENEMDLDDTVSDPEETVSDSGPDSEETESELDVKPSSKKRKY